MSVHFLPNAGQSPFPRAGRGRKPKSIASLSSYRREKRQAKQHTLPADEDERHASFFRAFCSWGLSPAAAHRVADLFAERRALADGEA